MPFKRFYNHLLAVLPWGMMAGIFQLNFRQLLPGQRFFKGSYFWDFFSVLDFYIVFLVLIFLLGLFLKKLSFNDRPLKKLFVFGFLGMLIAGVLEISFQGSIEPVLTSPSWYFLLFYVFPMLYVVLAYKTADNLLPKRLMINYLLMIVVYGGLCLIQYFFNVFPGASSDFLHRLSWPFIDFLKFTAGNANWNAFLIAPGLVISTIVLINNYFSDIAFLNKMKFEQAKLTNSLSLAEKCNYTVDTVLKYCAFGNLIIGSVVVFLTQSYSSYAAIYVALALFFLSKFNFKKFLIAMAILTAIFGTVFLVQKNSDKYKIMTGEKSYRFDNSMDSRKDIYWFNFKTFLEKPLFGVGLNQYQSYFAANQLRVLGHQYGEVQNPPHPHNFLVGMFMNLGLLGLLGVIAIIFSVSFVGGFKPQNLGLFLMILIMFHGLFDSYYFQEQIDYIFWVAVLISAFGKTASFDHNA